MLTIQVARFECQGLVWERKRINALFSEAPHRDWSTHGSAPSYRYPDQGFGFHLGLTRLYHLRRNFIRELAARRGAGNRPVERSAGNPHATFVRGTEASS